MSNSYKGRIIFWAVLVSVLFCGGCCIGCLKCGCSSVRHCLGVIVNKCCGWPPKCCGSCSMNIRECCHDGGVRIASWLRSFCFWLGQRMAHCRHCCNNCTESLHNCRCNCSAICCRRRQRELCLLISSKQ